MHIVLINLSNIYKQCFIRKHQIICIIKIEFSTHPITKVNAICRAKSFLDAILCIVNLSQDTTVSLDTSFDEKTCDKDEIYLII